MKKTHSNVDLFALRRDTEMSPGARLDWLAAAWEFTQDVERNSASKTSPKKDQ